MKSSHSEDEICGIAADEIVRIRTMKLNPPIRVERISSDCKEDFIAQAIYPTVRWI
ncbi:MAG: hypothetical protein IJ002_00400 [Clostridia bacterium]|nr:hypothetical protein [Clostridia bacterium]